MVWERDLECRGDDQDDVASFLKEHSENCFNTSLSMRAS